MLFAVLETTDVDNGPVTQTLMHSDAGRIAASAERAALMALFYRAEFTGGMRLKGLQPKVVVNRVLVIRAAAATLVMIALFFGVLPSKVAIIIRGLLLLTRRIMSRRSAGRCC